MLSKYTQIVCVNLSQKDSWSHNLLYEKSCVDFFFRSDSKKEEEGKQWCHLLLLRFLFTNLSALIKIDSVEPTCDSDNYNPEIKHMIMVVIFHNNTRASSLYVG